MKLLIDIKDDKSAFILELLNSFNFVKIEAITSEKAAVIKNIKQAVSEVNLIQDGKLEGILASDLLNEL